MSFEKVKSFECEGYECEIVKVIHLDGKITHNGYVTVPKSHPMYGNDYDDVDQEVTELTYGNKGKFGFDTNHLRDTVATQSEESVIEVTKELAKAFKDMEPVESKPMITVEEFLRDNGLLKMVEKEAKRQEPYTWFTDQSLKQELKFESYEKYASPISAMFPFKDSKKGEEFWRVVDLGLQVKMLDLGLKKPKGI